MVGGKLAEFVRTNGFQVFDYPIPLPSGDSGDVRSAADYVEWTGMAEPGFIRQAVEAELKAIQTFQPDAIFAESRPSASISAAVAQIPTLMIASWPSHPAFPANLQYPGSAKAIAAFNEVLAEYSQEPVSNLAELLFSRATIQMAPTLPELEPELDALKECDFAGYILDLKVDQASSLQWHPDWQDKPLIFIYLSVSAIPPLIYIEMVKEIFDKQPYRVACLCGFHYELKELPDNTDNIQFHWFIPAAEIMPEASLVIFHGGQDTMLTTMLYGLPSIAIPGQHFERDYNSTQLQNLGLTYKLPVQAFRPSRIRKIVQTALTEDAAELRDRYMSKLRSLSGTENCCAALISLAQKKQLAGEIL
ncbi:glycosyltransferase [Paenibacillus sp. CN-4]|uniref:glycosyltransferase n=1 Tax=Paenibacillus nanchangensis TaxID=3348343 RepID=UPI0039790A08